MSDFPDPIFDPDKCPVPPLPPVGTDPLFQDCAIPEAPGAIFACPDDIEIPVIGPTGFGGAQGFQGPQGWPGIQGFLGIQGFKGIQGDPGGSRGFQGPQGYPGDAGFPGFPGLQGPQGYIGFQGPQGPQGPQGTQGPQGPQCPQGPQGTQGTQGLQGPQGTQGPQGDTGPQGPQGPPGLPGQGELSAWGEIVSVNDDGSCEWEERIPDAAGAWIAGLGRGGGAADFPYDPAYEVNAFDVPVGSFVHLYRGYNNSPATDWRFAYEGPRVFIARALETIPAATSPAAPGRGLILIYQRSTSGPGWVPTTDPGVTVIGYNLAQGTGNEVANGKLIFVLPIDGLWVIFWEMCPTS